MSSDMGSSNAQEVEGSVLSRVLQNDLLHHLLALLGWRVYACPQTQIRWYFHQEENIWSNAHPPWREVLRQLAAFVSGFSALSRYPLGPSMASQEPRSAQANISSSLSFFQNGTGDGVRMCEQNSSRRGGSSQLAMDVASSTTSQFSNGVLGTEISLFCEYHDKDSYQHKTELRSLPWYDNVVMTEDIFDRMLQSMDTCLFTEDKTAWNICQARMRSSWTSMTFAYMSTSGKYRGYAAFCRVCHRFVMLECHKWNEAEREKQRSYWLNFWGVEGRADNALPVV